MVSRLSWGLWQYVECFFSYIPKVVYLLYTALASCLDALQCLMRRLAGLDVYYINTNTNAILGANGTPVYQQDPVLEFIMGILGIGENAAAYSALTTTFWSLTIFGAIVLVISTMVAIIKSHYNEDSGKTNPITYIYTAIKSVFTFAIVPVVVIAGFWLSSFMLRTLDNITAGYATEETLEGIYGANYNEVFAPMTYAEGKSEEKQIYTRYDFFSAGAPSTTQTFSGVLFKAAANDANKIRRGDFKLNAEDRHDRFYDFGIIGTSDSIPSTLTTDEEKTEWAAYQLDYAFANNLLLKNTTHAEVLYTATSAMITIADIDVFAAVGVIKSMSKYNVGLVWYYYNLWTFNFMVGFAGVIACFLLFASIIIGLMTRIIKSAALFLIYPAILGLAPLDEFGGFKKWRTEFMQQVLMAFGSIIGMNVFFLIFPYLGNISFFNVGILDYMVNIVIIITGLMMVKGFIGFLSGLVGGADAAAVGGDMGKQVAGAAMKAGGLMLGAGNIALKAGKFISGGGAVASVAGKGARIGLAKLGAHIDQKKAKNAEKDANFLFNTKGAANKQVAQNLMDTMAEDTMNDGAHDTERDEVIADLEREARRQGYTDPADVAWYVNKNKKNAFHARLYENDAAYKSNYDAKKDIVDREGFSNADDLEKYNKLRQTQENATTRVKQIRTTNYMAEDGKMVPKWGAQMIGNDARALGGAIAKGFKDGMKDLNLNIGGLIGTLGRATNYKLDDKGKIDGVYGEPKGAATTQAELENRRNIRRASVGRFGESLMGALIGYGNAGSKEPPPKTGDKLGQASLKEDQKQTKGIEELGRKIDKLTDAILKGK